jgi:Uncharacterized protein conserved in bacteria
MLCPVCKNIPLEDKELNLGLKGHSCSQCGGDWIRYSDYDDWIKTSKILNPTGLLENGYSLEYDNKKANICPDCGRILIKYKVSGQLPFYVDHCASCNGLWLDRNEWNGIVKKNLQYQVKDFFTSNWQEKIRREMSKQRFEDSYRSKFGEEDYIKLKEIREWIYKRKLKGEMISFLIDMDPYGL